MAFKKEYITDIGVPANYHLVSQVNLDKISKTGTIIVYIYLNQEIRESYKFLDKQYYDIRPNNYRLFEVDNLANYKDVYEVAYEWLKENVDYYNNAEEV